MVAMRACLYNQTKDGKMVAKNYTVLPRGVILGGGGLGGPSPPPPLPKEKEKKKKERKKEKRERKEKKREKRKKGTMNSVKLLHIKCCFSNFSIVQWH